jgi:hypothetical protein
VSDTFAKILASAPVNKQAAKVLGGGEHWVPRWRPDNVLRWDAPPKMKAVPNGVPNLVGIRFGRFTVIGLLDCENKDKAKWVCRCVCGTYEHRSAKAIRNPINVNDRCRHCGYLWNLKRRSFFERTGKWPEDTASDIA